jgi:hypothetical protein
MTLHKITEFYTGWFSVCSNITSKSRTAATFKSFVKQDDSNKTCRYGHICYRTNFHLNKCSGS